MVSSYDSAGPTFPVLDGVADLRNSSFEFNFASVRDGETIGLKIVHLHVYIVDGWLPPEPPEKRMKQIHGQHTWISASSVPAKTACPGSAFSGTASETDSSGRPHCGIQ